MAEEKKNAPEIKEDPEAKGGKPPEQEKPKKPEAKGGKVALIKTIDGTEHRMNANPDQVDALLKDKRIRRA